MDAILLAAGNSIRFGENKLLYSFRGKPVYQYTLDILYQLQKKGILEQIIVVSQYEKIFEQIKGKYPGVDVVRNPVPEKGISGSIRFGISRLEETAPKSEACLFAVADQPGLTSESAERLAAFWKNHAFGIVAAAYLEEGCPSGSGQGNRNPETGMPNPKNRVSDMEGKDMLEKDISEKDISEKDILKKGQIRTGNPVIFSSRYYGELKMLTGDRGGKQVMKRHREDAGFCILPIWELIDLDTKAELDTLDLEHGFSFLREKGHVISIVGAGGKTTLMYTLAACYGEKGYRVILSTTTHIKRPEHIPVTSSLSELEELLQRHSVVAVGTDAPQGKIKALHAMKISEAIPLADVILLEADGAKHHPCKVPAETEPVIPKESDIVIGVAGLDALGQPLEDVCFRKEKAMELLRTDARHCMNEQDLAEILSSDWGTRKNVENREYYVVLNQCDDDLRRRQGEKIKRMLEEKGITNVLCISLKNF